MKDLLVSKSEIPPWKKLNQEGDAQHLLGNKFTISFIIISLFFGLISFISCIIAEFKRNKADDLEWNGKVCSLPTSQAFGFGIAALVSCFFAQIIGNYMFFKIACPGVNRDAQYKTPAIAKVLFLISWLSFAIAVMLLTAATSMNRSQSYGIGWLNGECYLVKEGTYASSATLVLVNLGSIIVSTTKTSQADQGDQINTQSR